MNFYKKFTIFSSVLILTNIGLAKTESLIERINNKQTITVGTEGTYPPFTFHDKSGNLTGYDVEVTRAVAKKLGVNVEFKETEWASMLAGLKAGRFDMVANQVSLTTPERQRTFDKTVEYSFSGPVVVGLKSATFKINSFADIKGLRAAQSLSSNYGEIAQSNGAKLVPVDGFAQSVKLIEDRRVDITINDSLAVYDYLNKSKNPKIKIFYASTNPLGAGLVLNKNNEEAVEKLNQALRELHEEGVLSEISVKFFGVDVSQKQQ